jgi:hypothetical protein
VTYEGCIGDPRAGCISAPAGGPAEGIALSSDGASAYVVWGNFLSQLDRSPQGLLTPDGCYSSDGSSGCTDLPNIPWATAAAVALSPDGSSAYVAGDNSVTFLSREPPPGPVVPIPPPEPAPGDLTTQLVLDVGGKDRQRADSLKAAVTCTVDCTIELSAEGSAAGKNFASRTATEDLAAGETSVIKLSFKRSVLNRIEGERGHATLIGTATDATGQTAGDQVSAKLKR